MKHLLIILSISLSFNLLAQQQYADTSYSPVLISATYKIGEGSKVCIDEGHNNFHTKDGRYKPFSDLLSRDGYKVISYKNKFRFDSLSSCDILVIANALNEINTEQWYKPIYPAFSYREIKEVNEWVREGGSLFLIADHMPMAGAAASLAKSFGYDFNDGFASDSTKVGPDLFTIANGQLVESEIVEYNGNILDSIMSFTGQAFDIPANSQAILKGGKTWVSYQPDTAWQINDETPRIMADTLYQGAYQNYGKGRLVVFGEAAMFSAQIAEVYEHRFKAGMNRQGAENNHKLLLNIIHWLDPNFKK